MTQIPLNYAQNHKKSNPKSSAPYFLSNKTLLSSPGSLWVELYLFNRYSGTGTIWGNWAWIPQIMCRDTWKVIQSLQLLVSHQMRSYSSVKNLCGLSYTCFPDTRVLGQLEETGPEHPKSRARTHKKESKILSSLFHIKWDLSLESRAYVGWITWVLGQREAQCSNFSKIV